MRLTPGNRTRFDMIYAAPQREKSFVAVRDVGFDLLRRHAGIEGRDHDHRNVDFGKRSTGMRATVVSSTTITMRHIIRIKNGCLIAKEDIIGLPPCFGIVIAEMNFGWTTSPG